MFNPEITYMSPETFTLWDDCLSFPDTLVRVKRSRSISIKFINTAGQVETWNNLSRDVSELLQHEIDHLHGILAVNIVADPLNDPKIESGLVSRKVWEENKELYMSVVDNFDD